MKDVESIARELMSNAGTIREEFTTAKHLEHVRPMFQVKNDRHKSPSNGLLLSESLVAVFSGIQRWLTR